VLNVIKISLPSIFLPAVFVKALIPVHYFLSLYTIPLSTLISSLSLNYHVYADDTKLCFSFHPRNYDSSIAHLQTALKQISSWMSATANLLTLNSSQTEFIIIGPQQQVSKIDNSSLNTTHSARNLGFIFD